MNILRKTFFWLEDCPYDRSYDWSDWAAQAWYLDNWASPIIMKVTDG